jgi:hypothetical protein
LTSFNIGKALTPPVRKITVQDILNFFNWENIAKHPMPLIFISCLVAMWISLSLLFNFTEDHGYCPCCPMPSKVMMMHQQKLIPGVDEPEHVCISVLFSSPKHDSIHSLVVLLETT